MLGIIGGSGLSELAGLENAEEKLLATRYGPPSSAVVSGRLHGRQVAFMARHGRPHSIPPHRINYRANLLALQRVGVREIVAVNAVGGITDACEPGVLCLPDQIIDYTWGRAHTFYDDNSDVAHIDFSRPYTQTLRRRLLLAAASAGVVLRDGGVYGATQGPRLETAAEIRRMQQDGCDIVGMTGMPEAALARELGLDYACLAVVANRAAGLTAETITQLAIEEVMYRCMGQVKTLIGACCKGDA